MSDQLTDAEYAEIAADPAVRTDQCPGGAAGLAAWLGIGYRRGNAKEYDLASVTADQSPAIPRRTLIVAATYRSGSTALAEDLIRAGGHGWPLEYLQRGADTTRFARFAGDEYLERVMAHRTDPEGVFGIKLFPADVTERGIGCLSNSFPQPVVVWLRRQDQLAQAISALRALQGGPWRSIDAPTRHTPDYDFDALYRLTALFHDQDRWWAARLAAEVEHLGDPVTVWFEDLQRDHRSAVQDLLARLSERGRPSRRDPGQPRLRRQADAVSAAMADRFVVDYRDGRRPRITGAGSG